MLLALCNALGSLKPAGNQGNLDNSWAPDVTNRAVVLPGFGCVGVMVEAWASV